MKLAYSPALDGIRAIAILSVMAHHASVPFVHGANLGVDLFFVLSGYLVGRMLLAEYSSTGRLDLRSFYQRRIWRLLPALVLMLTLYAGFAPIVWPDYWFHLRDVVSVLLYIPDIALSFGHGPHYLLHGWSLGIEERFYLLAPWLLLVGLAILGLKRLWSGLLILLLLLWCWECYCFLEYSSEFYYRFDLRISGLLIGVLLAAVGPLQLKPGASVGWWMVAGLLSVWGMLLLLPSSQAWRLGVGGFLLELGVLFSIAWVVSQPDGVLGRALSQPILVYVGKISYGLYLFHYPLMQYLKTQMSWSGVWLLGSLGALLMAMVSWHCLELPINRWRKKRYLLQVAQCQ